MDQNHLQGRTDDRLELARLELDALEEGLARLRRLLDEACDEPTSPHALRFRREDDPGGPATARGIAAQMALTGSPRGAAEQQLRGMVPPEELSDILNDAYVVGD